MIIVTDGLTRKFRYNLTRSVAGAFFLFFIFFRSAFASPFSDLPPNHWATEAVLTLLQEGILKGADGQFRGEKPATRYEMAQAVVQILLYLDAHPDQVKNKQELEVLKSLAKEYRDELDGYGVRMNQVEQVLSNLWARVDEASRVKFFVHSDNVGAEMWVARKGSNFVQAFDFANGRPVGGSATTGAFGDNFFLSSRFDLDVTAPLSDDWKGGGRVSAFSGAGFNAAGDPRTYWGVTPPYLNNWWTGLAGGLPQADLERVWARYDPSDMEAIYGTYFLRSVDGSVLKEQPNPTIYGPDNIPLFGEAVRGNLTELHFPWISYEMIKARIPNQSPYITKALADETKFDLGKTVISIDFLRVDDDVQSLAAPAPVVTPLTNPFRLQSTLGTTVTSTGPQAQYSWGGKVVHRFSPTFRGTAEYAVSRYSPDTTGSLIATGAQTGHLFRVQAEGSLLERGAYSVEYISVDPTYDPYVLGYPGGAIIRNFAIWNNLPNFYFLHDSANYPQNRQGIKGNVQWNFGQPGVLLLYGSSLTQKVATAILGNGYPVYVEPVFSTSPNAALTLPLPFLSTNRGTIRQLGAMFSSQVTKRLKGDVSLALVRLLRGQDSTTLNNVNAPGFQNNWDETYTVGSVNFNYSLTRTVTAQTGISDTRLVGTQNGFPGYSMNQVSWFAGISHNLTEQAAFALEYRLYNTKEASPPFGSLYPLSSQGPFFGNSQAGYILGRLLYNF